MVAIAGFTKEQILNAVRQMYTEVTTTPSKEFHFPTGRQACLFVGYPVELLDTVPMTAVESFAGVGCPSAPMWCGLETAFSMSEPVREPIR
jgi:hypothetical protein